MKEFLLGGLISIWFIMLGVSSINITLTILTIVYPIFVVLLIINYMIIKQMLKLNKQKVLKQNA